MPATFNSQATDGGCEQNTFSQCMLCQHIALHSFRGARSFGLCAQNRLRLLRSFSRRAQYTQHSVLYISHYHWSPMVDHIQIHENPEVTVLRIQNLAQKVGVRPNVKRMLEFDVCEEVSEELAGGWSIWNSGLLDSQKKVGLFRSRLVVKHVCGQCIPCSDAFHVVACCVLQRSRKKCVCSSTQEHAERQDHLENF